MTTATTEGRRLVLRVEGIDEPFFVDPLPAKRGRALTELFVKAARSQLTGENIEEASQESVFIESINPKNYVRMGGVYVDEYDATGAYLHTHGLDVTYVLDELAGNTSTSKYTAREALPGIEDEIDGDPIRQEECESLALCAFYWQTVVGIEAVNAFIDAGEGTEGNLKALALLSIRIGISPSTNSSSPALGSWIQEDVSKATAAISNSSGSVQLPAKKRGFMQNPRKRKPTPHR